LHVGRNCYWHFEIVYIRKAVEEESLRL
jgi:hypothetical protein